MNHEQMGSCSSPRPTFHWVLDPFSCWRMDKTHLLSGKTKHTSSLTIVHHLLLLIFAKFFLAKPFGRSVCTVPTSPHPALRDLMPLKSDSFPSLHQRDHNAPCMTSLSPSSAHCYLTWPLVVWPWAAALGVPARGIGSRPPEKSEGTHCKVGF